MLLGEQKLLKPLKNVHKHPKSIASLNLIRTHEISMNIVMHFKTFLIVQSSKKYQKTWFSVQWNVKTFLISLGTLENATTVTMPLQINVTGSQLHLNHLTVVRPVYYLFHSTYNLEFLFYEWMNMKRFKKVTYFFALF